MPANTGRAVVGSMHRSYQPLKPVANRYLQQRWDQEDYQNHRQKVRKGGAEGGGPGLRRCSTGLHLPVQVSCSLPAVDTRGTRTPAHIQLKLKKLQVR